MAPSISAMSESARNGTALPANSYRKPPNGGANRQPNEMNASAMPCARVLSLASQSFPSPPRSLPRLLEPVGDHRQTGSVGEGGPDALEAARDEQHHVALAEREDRRGDEQDGQADDQCRSYCLRPIIGFATKNLLLVLIQSTRLP